MLNGANFVPSFSQEASAHGKEVSIPPPRSSDGPSNIEAYHHDPQTSRTMVFGIHADGESLHSTTHTLGAGLVSYGLQADMPTTLDKNEATPPILSSLQEKTLNQELADFLMPSRLTSVRVDQANRSVRKRTKSRKVLENETLWKELTAVSKGSGSVNDFIFKDTQSMPGIGKSRSDVCIEEPKVVDGKQDCLKSREFLSTNTAGNLVEVNFTGSVANEITKSTPKRRKGQGLKERARSGHAALPTQHDVSRFFNQVSDIDILAPEHVGYNPSAMRECSTGSQDHFRDYNSIEIVEDWQSYCPYEPFSQNLIHTYEDSRSTVISLPLFSSSRLTHCTDKLWPEYYDLVLNAGGSVWALDWCPRRICVNDSRTEILAVAAHPHDSPTHRLGEIVQGRGIIQIWAFDFSLLPQAQASWHHQYINGQAKGKQKPRGAARARGRTKKWTTEEDESKVAVGDIADGPCGFESPPAQVFEDKRHHIMAGVSDAEKVEHSVYALMMRSAGEHFDPPQMVLGIAHEGGLVWDAKWQPVNAHSVGDSGRLGYLAAIFGDGSMQVFDVPLPNLVSKYRSLSKDIHIPLIVKMKPVFKCFGLSSSGQKSMPLTLEWSSSPPYNLLLVGCHDGSVALWTFDPQSSHGNDTRPLTCYVADTGPIRALAFAPDGNDVESRNVIVTGGHSGRLLFWDLRDPFYPLWDLSLSKGGCILSIDWLLYPSGIVLSMDDGTIKTLSLDVSCDLPLTGTPPPKSVLQGMHTTFSSDYAVWSVHVSRASGIAVYGGEDGSIVHCQLTEKYFVNDRARAREPHYLCCKLTEDSCSGVLSLDSINSDLPLQVKNQRADSKQVPLNKASLSRRASGNMCEEDQFKIKLDRVSAKKRKVGLLETRDPDDEDFSLEEVDPMALVPYDPNISSKPKSKSRSLSTTVGKEADKNHVMQQLTPPSLGKYVGNLPEMGGSAVPPKAVSVHRVRWNQNRGCENLVCFGGAAGIIRCQLILPRCL